MLKDLTSWIRAIQSVSWSPKISRATFPFEFPFETSFFVEARTYINVVSSESGPHRWERLEGAAKVPIEASGQVQAVDSNLQTNLQADLQN